MPSRLIELEQLHVQPNSGHSTTLGLHHSSTHCRLQKAGWGQEMRQGMNEWSRHGLEQLHVESNGDRSRHLSPTLSMHIPSPVTKTTIGLICICLGEESPSPPHHYHMKPCSSTAVTTVRLF